MNRFNDMKTTSKLALLGGTLALAAGTVSAEVYDLCAGETAITLPDGSSVPMWGYALGTDDGAGGCAGKITIPGPRLVVSDGTLQINLTNTLPEPTSIVIPGLPLPTPLGPTWNDGTVGARNVNADPPQRVRSFGAETDAEGGTGTYAFTVDRPGTFLYHSGTQPQKQVYMGLYGAVTQDAAASEVYPGVAYDNEVVLFYSDIDPAFNAAVADGTLITAMGRHPSWFLVNGEPYEDGVTEDIAIGAAGDRTLLRLLSAATETHVPVLQGQYMTIHAEDALQYAWEDTATGDADFAPREQYSAVLPPLKTKDAIVQPLAEGRYAVYDGNGYMTNPSDPGDTTVGDTVGGMLRFLAAGAGVDTDGDGILDAVDNCPNVSNENQLDSDGDGIGDACDTQPSDTDGDGIVDADDNCPTTTNVDQADADGDGVGNVCDNCPTISNADQADADGDGIGDACEVDTDGDGVIDDNDNCPTIANADQADADADGIGDVCEPDTDGDGFIDDLDNCPTVANADQADLDNDGIGDACDTDVDGDNVSNTADNCPLTANADQVDGDGDGVGDVCDNCPDTPNADQLDTDGDGIGDVCEVANIPPVAEGDAATVAQGRGNSVRFNLTGNDTDEDGTIDPDTIVIVTQPSQATVTVHNDGTGEVTLTLSNNGGNNRAFTYTVNDNEGATSNAALVEVQVD